MEEEEVYEPPPPPKIEETKKKKKGKKGQKNLYVLLNGTHYPLVHNLFTDLGYISTDSEFKADIIWTDSGGSSEIVNMLEPWQFYNHFPAIWSIAHKAELFKNLLKMEQLLPEYYSFHPKSFLLPGQYAELKTFQTGDGKGCTFIVKPDKGAQGRGIFLIQDPSNVENYTELAVAQHYLPPYLVDGYKFDLRIYVLLLSIDPLRIYLHEEGMARFCTEKYSSPVSTNLNRAYSHLTNYSLNKKNDKYQKTDDESSGSKRSLSYIYEYIAKNGGDVPKLKEKIDRIVRLTVASIHPLLIHNYKSSIQVQDGKCRLFEILGFDILIDENLEPWLIEVNNMPSLCTDQQFDKSLKTSVVKGCIELLGLKPGFKKSALNHQKLVTQQRISGVKDTNIVSLYSEEQEEEIAANTNYRLIYPVKQNKEEHEIMLAALEKAREAPVVGANETFASKARKEKIKALLKEKEMEKIPFSQLKKLKQKTKTQSKLNTTDNKDYTTVERKSYGSLPEPNESKVKSSRIGASTQQPRKSINDDLTRQSVQFYSRPPNQLIRRKSDFTGESIYQLFPGIHINEADECKRIRVLKLQSNYCYSIGVTNSLMILLKNFEPCRRESKQKDTDLHYQQSQLQHSVVSSSSQKVVHPILKLKKIVFDSPVDKFKPPTIIRNMYRR